jgi:hypothetical protein
MAKAAKKRSSSMGLRKMMRSPKSPKNRGGLGCSKLRLMQCRKALNPGCTWVVAKGCRNVEGRKKRSKSPKKSPKKKRSALKCAKKKLMECRDARPGCTWVVGKGCRNRSGRKSRM